MSLRPPYKHRRLRLLTLSYELTSPQISLLPKEITRSDGSNIIKSTKK